MDIVLAIKSAREALDLLKRIEAEVGSNVITVPTHTSAGIKEVRISDHFGLPKAIRKLEMNLGGEFDPWKQ